jgi:hypothetical protein
MGKPPAQSRLVREKTVAFAEAKDDKKKKGDDKKPDEAKADEAKADEAKADAQPAAEAKADAQPAAEARSDETRPYDKADDDAEPEKPVVSVSSPRAHTETMAMPSELASHGKPPELPAKPPAAPIVPVSVSEVESPTNMPLPKHVPDGTPDDPAAPPGRVPPGDSRSLRKAGEFSLIYRMGTFVISRTGTIGKRGVWRVVEYPTSSAASHGYAKECSRFVSDGFSDYRD